MSDRVPTQKSKFVEFLKSYNFNFWGTLTLKHGKTETKLRKLLFGDRPVRKYNATNLPVYLINDIYMKSKSDNPYSPWDGRALINYLNTPKVKEQLKFYKNGEVYNDKNIRDNQFDIKQDNYGLSRIVEKSGTSVFFAIMEYGSKTGYPHLHFLLHHPNVEDVDSYYNKRGKKRVIPRDGHPLRKLFMQMQRIGHSQLDKIEGEGALHYITKYLFKQNENFANNMLEPLGEHRNVCSKKHTQNNYCIDCYKGTYYGTNTKSKIQETPIFRLIKYNNNYISKNETKLNENYKMKGI